MSGPVGYFDQITSAADLLRARVGEVPSVGIVLGSGLGEFAGGLSNPVTVPYGEVPHWPQSRVTGHDGRLVVGASGRQRMIALAGRVHLYEGHDARTVAFPVRVLGALGVTTLILTNAAGGVNAALKGHPLMIVDDHRNLSGANPLAALDDERCGSRFPDMTEVYSARLRAIADEAGRALGLTLPHGVYAAVLGPSYETPAEIRYLRSIGADAVGMSTVPEAIVARQIGIELLGISCITNMAAGLAAGPLSHDDVLDRARSARRDLAALVEQIVARL